MWEKEQLTQPYIICNPDHQRQAPNLLTLAEAPKLLSRGYMVFSRPIMRTYVGLKLQTSPMHSWTHALTSIGSSSSHHFSGRTVRRKRANGKYVLLSSSPTRKSSIQHGRGPASISDILRRKEGEIKEKLSPETNLTGEMTGRLEHFCFGLS